MDPDQTCPKNRLIRATQLKFKQTGHNRKLGSLYCVETLPSLCWIKFSIITTLIVLNWAIIHAYSKTFMSTNVTRPDEKLSFVASHFCSALFANVILSEQQ